jgi:hypothetical protein
LEASAADDEIAGDCPWDVIIAGFRRHAAEQADDLRNDLSAWADLLEGLAALEQS